MCQVFLGTFITPIYLALYFCMLFGYSKIDNATRVHFAPEIWSLCIRVGDLHASTII